MAKKFRSIQILVLFMFTGTVLSLTACGAATPTATATPVPSEVPTDAPSATPTIVRLVPQITGVELNLTEVPRYESIEMKVALQATYTNPYDAREVRLDAVFNGPDGAQMIVPGFWDGKDSWKVRFTPSRVGEWRYQVAVNDAGGESAPANGTFNVTTSDLHGWLQIGKTVDPSYSSRYLAHHDGTPFYGLGYCEALNILTGGFDLDRGVPVFNELKEANGNFVVWWPLYSNSPIGNSYNQYHAPSMDVMDIVVKDAQKKNVFLIFTVWDHPQLRDDTHSWGTGNWTLNGFSKLGSIDSFFTSDESWVWQQNFYRYIIARWGYSPAIGMWQTASEINGTNAYDQTNPWHEKVNAYFVENDPYRHPTTASMSGDVNWPEGHAVMDAPQVHLYDFKNGALPADAVKAAAVLAHWTRLMWDQAEKPNWVGEFGVPSNQDYPELFHNSIWAALASGAAMTPAEWNSGGPWGEMTQEMNADLGRLAQFVADIPLVKWNPAPLGITSADPSTRPDGQSGQAPQVRGWGVAGSAGGLFWVQDFALEGKTIDEVRKDETVHTGVQIEIEGLPAGTYTVTPYDTWQGKYGTAFQVTCEAGQACELTLPNFHADMAFKLEVK